MGMRPRIDLIGRSFGRWTILALGSLIGTRRKFLCRCECGTVKEVAAQDLRNGRSVSCGCYSREAVAKRATIHGMSHHPMYKVWVDMKRRCYNSNDPEFVNYGERGIIVCPEWIQSFPAFYNDMGERPFHGATLDRINNDGNYEPGNCRWVTNKENNRNKRKHRMITYNGNTLCSAEWAEIGGVEPRLFRARLNKGWSMERAMEPPVPKSEGSHRSVVL